MEHAYQAAVAALAGATRVCIITHIRPDADAVGSACALMAGLRQLHKEATVVIGQQREVAANLLSIPGAQDIVCQEDFPAGYDLYVTVDCGSVYRTGTFAGELVSRSDVVCIDHHASNPGFGAINVVDVQCESTTVVLTQILDALGVQLNKHIAHCLYAGLVTDTGCFRWGRPVMHDYASRFLRYGLDSKQIAMDLLDSTSPADLQMIGRVLSDLRIVPAGEHVIAVLAASLECTVGASEVAVESLVDHVRGLAGTGVGVVFKEQSPGEWAVSVRSASVDCAAIAGALGGGGHVSAAGYTAHGSVTEIIDQLVMVVGK